MRWRLSVALICLAAASQAEPLTYLRSMPLDGLGGLSAIEVEPGGSPALVLSDRGTGHRFKIIREGDTGRIAELAPVRLPYPNRDTEGLAKSRLGTFYSYEGPARVSRDNGEALPDHLDFITYHKNGSLEALAAAPDGTLYTLPERLDAKQHPIYRYTNGALIKLPERLNHKKKSFPIYRYSNGRWDVVSYLPQRGPFQPTGADIGPDGLLYILERAFTPLGFRSRIRRVDPNSPGVEAQTLITTSPGVHDNLEGISVWQSHSGATCLTLVSDDNFLAIQTSELVEYALTETLAGDASCD